MLQPTNAGGDSSGELAAVVDDLLSQLNTKFSTISSELLAKSKPMYLIVQSDDRLIDLFSG